MTTSSPSKSVGIQTDISVGPIDEDNVPAASIATISSATAAAVSALSAVDSRIRRPSLDTVGLGRCCLCNDDDDSQTAGASERDSCSSMFQTTPDYAIAQSSSAADSVASSQVNQRHRGGQQRHHRSGCRHDVATDYSCCCAHRRRKTTTTRFTNSAINADSITTSNERRLVSFNRQDEYIHELELEQGPYRTSVANIGSRKHAFTRLLLMHLERTSAHALPRVARTRSLCRRILWLGTFAFFVGYFIYQLVSLLTMFYSYPVGATILIEQQRMMDFPAVTVCNLNMLKASQLVNDSRYRILAVIDRTTANILHEQLPAVSKFQADLLRNEKQQGSLPSSPTDHVSNNQQDDKPVRRHSLDSHQLREQLSDVKYLSYLLSEAFLKQSQFKRSVDDRATTFVSDDDEERAEQGQKGVESHNAAVNHTETTGGQGEEARYENDRNVLSTTAVDGSNWTMPVDYRTAMNSTNVRSTQLLLLSSEEKRGSHLQRDKKNIKPSDLGTSSSSSRQPPATSSSSSRGDFYYEETGFTSVMNDYEFEELKSKSMTADYSDLLQLLKPTIEDLDRFGHQPKDFIIQCSFDTRNCSYSDFYRRVSPFFGNCFTFNHRVNGTQSQVSSKYGSRYGLRLTLNIEHDDYLGLFSHKAGVRVTIHPFDVTPFPEDFGLNAMPGCETEIGVAVENIKRVPHPHPSNCTDRKKNLFSNGFGDAYTVLSCNKYCLQRKLELECGCVDSEVTSASAEIPRCISTNSTQEKCRQFVRHRYENDQRECDCPPPCEIRNNLVSVHVYLTDMNVRQIEEHPSYPWDRLLADIGGMLGLFIGISACTAVEFIEFLVDASILAVSRCYSPPRSSTAARQRRLWRRRPAGSTRSSRSAAELVPTATSRC